MKARFTIFILFYLGFLFSSIGQEVILSKPQIEKLEVAVKLSKSKIQKDHGFEPYLVLNLNESIYDSSFNAVITFVHNRNDIDFYMPVGIWITNSDTVLLSCTKSYSKESLINTFNAKEYKGEIVYEIRNNCPGLFDEGYLLYHLTYSVIFGNQNNFSVTHYSKFEIPFSTNDIYCENERRQVIENIETEKLNNRKLKKILKDLEKN